MRYLLLIASLALTGNALADEKLKTAAKELDKSSPQMTSTDSSSERAVKNEVKAEAGDFGLSRANERSKGQVRAQDYNSSRSNTTAVREDKVGDLDGDGRPDVVTCRDGVDEDCNDADAGPTRAQDYNSSRSNISTSKLEPDDDRESLREVRCSTRSADCVDAANGDDPVVRKRPGR